MKPDLPATVPDGADAAARAAANSFGRLDVQHQAGPGRRNRADVDAFDTEKRICLLAPATARAGGNIGHIRVSFELGNLVATNSKRP
jgi:hypothetical protein